MKACPRTATIERTDLIETRTRSGRMRQMARLIELSQEDGKWLVGLRIAARSV